jgi:beta-glucosidase-like glycosyl hydrolase
MKILYAFSPLKKVVRLATEGIKVDFKNKCTRLFKRFIVPLNCNLINFPMFNNQALKFTLEKKLYQLIVSRLDGYSINSQAYEGKIFQLVERGIGGFIIFGGRMNEIKDFIHKIQSASEIPLFIASDVECGVGRQIQDTTLFPCQMAMAAAIEKEKSSDVVILETALRAIAEELIDVGINMPLIPVLDVNQNPENPIVCTRAFSDKPEDVAWFGTKYIKELEGAGLISCAKHFPGHGDTAIDSHISLPVITKSFEELLKIDVMPFAEAIKAGVRSIMVGHLSIPAIDSKPASLSKKIINDLLRKELGYDGLILTDALNMKALKCFENISTECIKAGADILLHPSDADATARELGAAVKEDMISERDLDIALNRILKAKAKIQNITTLCPPFIRGELKGGEVDYKSHEILSLQITDKSITLLKDLEGLPIADKSRVYVVLAGENKFFESSPLKTIFKNVSTIPSLIPLPQGEGVRARVEYEFSEQVVIFAIFTSIAAWKGTSGIDDMERKQISELIEMAKTSIVISFGCPYVLRHFKKADVLVAAYETTEQAQRAVVKCLQGEMDFKGRLPVKI